VAVLIGCINKLVKFAHKTESYISRRRLCLLTVSFSSVVKKMQVSGCFSSSLVDGLKHSRSLERKWPAFWW